MKGGGKKQQQPTRAAMGKDERHASRVVRDSEEAGMTAAGQTEQPGTGFDDQQGGGGRTPFKS